MVCKRCGECCKTVGAEIPTPETVDDFEDIKWYLYHPGISVYIDRDGSWNIEFRTRCIHLTRKKECAIYDKRPPMCRDFDSSACDIDDEEDPGCYEFTEPEQVDEYINEMIEKGKLKKK